MIFRVALGIWVGDSDAAFLEGERAGGISAVLNTAADLPPPLVAIDDEGRYRIWERWQGVEYAQVNLLDGPGNTTADYCAAVLTLASLVERHAQVLVYDHGGGRGLAVALMYLGLARGRRPAGGSGSAASSPHCWEPWSPLREYVRGKWGGDWPEVHEAHAAAYDKLPFAIMETLLA